MSNAFWKVYEMTCMKGRSVNVMLITSSSDCGTAGKMLQQNIVFKGKIYFTAEAWTVFDHVSNMPVLRQFKSLASQGTQGGAESRPLELFFFLLGIRVSPRPTSLSLSLSCSLSFSHPLSHQTPTPPYSLSLHLSPPRQVLKVCSRGSLTGL